MNHNWLIFSLILGAFLMLITTLVLYAIPQTEVGQSVLNIILPSMTGLLGATGTYLFMKKDKGDKDE